MAKKKLSFKQKMFCKFYIENWNATDSARRAGYSVKYANTNANKLLHNTTIKEYIGKIQKDLEKSAGISRLSQLLEYKKIAYSSIAQFHNTWIERKELDVLTDDQKACIESIDTRVQKRAVEGGTDINIEQIKIKLYDKQKALDSINKMLGYNEPDKINHSGNPKIVFENISKEFDVTESD